MTTSLLNDPRVPVVHVGDVVADAREDLLDSSIALRPLPLEGPIVMLQGWFCASCRSQRFAHVTFDDLEGGTVRVARIEAVHLTRSALDAAHVAYEFIVELYEDFVGQPFDADGTFHPDSLDRLRAKLPAAPPGVL